MRNISSQKGRVFEHSDYNKLKPVLSYWVMFNPDEKDKNTIEKRFWAKQVFRSSMDEKAKIQDTGLMTSYRLNIGDPDEPGCMPILRLLGIVASDTHSLSEKKRILEEEFKLPMTEELEKEMATMSNLSQAIRERAYLQGSQDKEIELNGKIEELNRQHLQDKVDITSIFLDQGYSLEASLEMAKVPNEDRCTAMIMLKNKRNDSDE